MAPRHMRFASISITSSAATRWVWTCLCLCLCICMGEPIDHWRAQWVVLEAPVSSPPSPSPPPLQEIPWSITDNATLTPTRCAWDMLHIRVTFPLIPFDVEITAPNSTTMTMTMTMALLEKPPGDAAATTPRVVTESNVTATLQPTQRRAPLHPHHLRPRSRSRPHAPIACAGDSLTDSACVPRLVGIQLPNATQSPEAPALMVNDQIVLQFADATTQPRCDSRHAIAQFVQFPTYVGHVLSGVWHDAQTLEITVKALDTSRVASLPVLMNTLVHTTLRLPTDEGESTDGHDTDEDGHGHSDEEKDHEQGGATAVVVMVEARYRIGRVGSYHLQLTGLYMPEEEEALLYMTIESPLFDIQTCTSSSRDSAIATVVVVPEADEQGRQQTFRGRDESILPPPSLSPPRLPEPSVMIRGVTSHASHEALEIADHRFASMSSTSHGSWALSMWVFLLDDATDQPRTLFFHGNGSQQHRTPSAWLRPENRRLVLRASTALAMDVGGDSHAELPLREWVHLGFTFRNLSSSATETGRGAHEEEEEATEEEDPTHKTRDLYSMTLFVNGELDQDIRLQAPALANKGPLQIASGPWTDGFRGFVSNARVFSEPLTEQQHHALYISERQDHATFQEHEDCERFLTTTATTTATRTSTNQVPMDAARQIAYLVQCNAITARKEDALVASHLHDSAMQKLTACEPGNSWDLLLEAADMGHGTALCQVGEAFLYGSYAIPETVACGASANTSSSGAVQSISDAIHVSGGIDLERAQRYLMRAVYDYQQWDAAVPLVLAHAVASASSSFSWSLPPSPIERLTLGLYHLAAASGTRYDGFALLGRMYSTVADDAYVDVAAYHYSHAASAASQTFHARGQQPHHEMNRLYDAVNKQQTVESDRITRGQLGLNDELIQYQQLRADRPDGDVAAMAAMGDLFYWGARGVPRNHARAYHYFHRAAQRGHASAQAALAGMLLRGEVDEKAVHPTAWNETARYWYEQAVKHNNTRALNGLGFLHFHGRGGLTENKTHALALFERAAANHEDGDSIFNAGFCHAHALGTHVNRSRAIGFYQRAAQGFGHFDAILELGKAWLHGLMEHDDSSARDGWVGQRVVVAQDNAQAITYLRAATEAGSWGSSVRKGFELFLAGEYTQAAVRYHEAQQYGYAVATSNLAYLYDQQLRHHQLIADTNREDSNISPEMKGERRALQYLVRASRENGDTEALVRIGDYHFYGMGGLPVNFAEAIRWYTRASAEGVPLGAYNVGHMNENGLGVDEVNLERAERYYRRVLELSGDGDATHGAKADRVVVMIALARIRARRWLQGSPLEAWLVAITGSGAQLWPPTIGLETDEDTMLMKAGGHPNSLSLSTVFFTLFVVALGIVFARHRARHIHSE